MKILEILGGINIMISNEENDLVAKVKESQFIPKYKLTDREKEIAKNLVTRGVLIRSEMNERIIFKVNELEQIWRI